MGSSTTGGRGGHLDLVNDDGRGSSDLGEWRGNELLMRIVSSNKPRYPEALRQAGIEGRVVVRFTVDTVRRVDMARVDAVRSTNDQFPFR